MVMKHDAHPLLLDEEDALLVGCAPSTLDMNLVDVCVSIAGPVALVVDRRVVVGATGAVVEGGNVVLDELEEEVEGGGAFVVEEEEEVVDVVGGVVGVVVTGGGDEEGGLVLGLEPDQSVVKTEGK